MKTFTQTSKVLILSIAVLTVLGYAQAAWEAPAGEPSASNNAPAPINVSSSNQDKLGGFAAASLVADTITSPQFCIPGQGCITGWGSGENSLRTFFYDEANNVFSGNGGTISVENGGNLVRITFDSPKSTANYGLDCTVNGPGGVGTKLNIIYVKNETGFTVKNNDPEDSIPYLTCLVF